MIKELDYTIYNDRASECLISEEEETIRDLKETLLSLDRPYLCANEIGLDKRIIAIKFDEDKPIIFANPIYQVRDNICLIREKDFNTDKEYIIPRYKDITLCYQREDGETSATKFNEEASPLVCQAMECLDGIHPSDYGLEVIPEFDEATDEEREEVIKFYINSLKDLEYSLDKDLQSDSELSNAWRSYKFNKGVADGEVELYKEEPKLNRAQRRLLSKLEKKLGRRSKNEVS